MKYFCVMKRRLLHIAILCFFLSLHSLVFAYYTSDNVPNPKEKGLSNWISNPDEILSENIVIELNNQINRLYDSTSAQIAVVVIKGDEQTSARELSMELFDKWKVGQKGMDNGLIILVVTQSRQCFLRTGYGLEGCLTDAYTTKIFNRDMKPYFIQGNWDEGVRQGTLRCIETIYKEYISNGHSLQKPNNGNRGILKNILTVIIIYFVVGIIVFVYVLYSLPQSSNHINDNYKIEKYKSYIASYNKYKNSTIIFIWWLSPILSLVYKKHQNKVRKTSVVCYCGEKMRLLSEQEEDAYLNPKAQFEETIGSRDYDVWVCDNCNNVVIYPFDIKDSYKECVICGAKAEVKKEERIVKNATAFSNGILRKTYVCEHCKHKRYEDSVLPRESMPIFLGTDSSRSFGGFSGGFGGGFSGGSFGGGFSGGGGGGGSW